MSDNYEVQNQDLRFTLSGQILELDDSELDDLAGGGFGGAALGALAGGLGGAISGGLAAYADAAYSTLVEGKPFDTSSVDNEMIKGGVAGAIGGALAVGVVTGPV